MALCGQGQQVGCHESDPTPGVRRMGVLGCCSERLSCAQDHFRKYANREAETAGFVSLLFVSAKSAQQLDLFHLNRRFHGLQLTMIDPRTQGPKEVSTAEPNSSWEPNLTRLKHCKKPRSSGIRIPRVLPMWPCYGTASFTR